MDLCDFASEECWLRQCADNGAAREVDLEGVGLIALGVAQQDISIRSMRRLPA
jgi:hypothetical protein